MSCLLAFTLSHILPIVKVKWLGKWAKVSETHCFCKNGIKREVLRGFVSIQAHFGPAPWEPGTTWQVFPWLCAGTKAPLQDKPCLFLLPIPAALLKRQAGLSLSLSFFSLSLFLSLSLSSPLPFYQFTLYSGSVCMVYMSPAHDYHLPKS